MALLWVTAPPVHAQRPASDGAITVAALRSWPPEYEVGEDGKPRGFAIDVMDAVADRAGLELVYRIFDTFPEAIEALHDGRVDVIPNLGITPERAGTLGFTTPMETVVISLFVRSESRGLEGPGSFGERRLAVVRSNRARPALRGVVPPETLRTYPDAERAVFALLAGQVDGLVYPEPVIWGIAEKAGVADHLRVVGEPLEEVRRGIATRRGDERLRARLDRAVRDLVGSPAYREIYRRWYGRRSREWRASRVLWTAAILVFATALAVLLWRYRLVLDLRTHRSGRQRAEEEARESRARLQAVADNLAEGLIVADLEGTVEYVNPRLLEMTGYTREECLGRGAAEFLGPNEPRDRIEARLAERRSGHRATYEVQLRRKDGELLWVEVHASPFIDARGEIVGSLAALVDISERRQAEAELEAAEEMLRHAQKMEAVGRLAGGLAHDFNNLLTTITGYGSLLQAELPPDDGRRDHVDHVLRAAESAAALTGQLLAFSRRQMLQPKVIDLNGAVSQVHGMLCRLLEADIELSLDLAPDLPPVVADPVQVEQILFNLAVNARDAMPRGGVLSLRTSTDGASPQGRILLEVRDTGLGMTPEVQGRIFEPFYTTKELGQGTGLGLSTVYGIVQQSGGSIDVESAPGHGATFRIYLPRAGPGEVVEPVRADRGPGRSTGAGEETLLLVEDDPQVRRLQGEVLRQAGYSVLEAECGRRALEILQNGGSGVALVVADVVMPGMGGIELVRELWRRHPGCKVLYTSGYAEGRDRIENLEEGRAAFLQKPFPPAEMLAAVRNLLDGG